MSIGFISTDSGVKLANLPSDPSSPLNGLIYYNTVSNLFRQYQNGTWVSSATLSDLTAYLKADGTTPMTGALDLNSNLINNVTDPVNPQDAATKNYVDTHSGTASSALDGTFVIQNTADNTKQLNFDASGITSGATRTLKMADANVDLANLTNSNIFSGAAIAYSKLNLSNSIVNADIASAAAIALTKLAALSTHNRALQSDGSGFITESSVTSTELGYVSGVTSAIQTQLNATEKTANKGTANGYAPLDAGGKVPYANLPSALMTFKGAWDASTNTPTLADGSGTTGDVYRASVAGTQDLGSGPQTWAVGDFAIYNGTIWQHSPAADGVSSVNGNTGAVTVNAINQLTGDVTAGPASGSQSQVATIAAGAVTASKLGTVTDGVTLDQSGSGSTLEVKTGGISNTQINASAAIAYSKLALTGSIVNADINASAAIALSKLAALATGKALQSNASTGFIEVSSVTNTELGYLSGVTSAIQTQLNGKVSSASPTFTGTVSLSSGSNVIEEQYSTGLTITGSQTGTAITGLNITATSYSSRLIYYSFKQTTSNFVRTGTLVAVYDGTTVSISDPQYLETGATGLSFDTDISGGNWRILYSSGTNGGTLNCRDARIHT